MSLKTAQHDEQNVNISETIYNIFIVWLLAERVSLVQDGITWHIFRSIGIIPDAKRVQKLIFNHSLIN